MDIVRISKDPKLYNILQIASWNEVEELRAVFYVENICDVLETVLNHKRKIQTKPPLKTLFFSSRSINLSAANRDAITSQLYNKRLASAIIS